MHSTDIVPAHSRDPSKGLIRPLTHPIGAAAMQTTDHPTDVTPDV